MHAMIDREKVLTVLRRRFPTARPEDVAAAANAIMGMSDEWEDVTSLDPGLPTHLMAACCDNCVLARDAADREFRLFRRRSS
jgi:hypothetical protein